jgi:hypothetical protein
LYWSVYCIEFFSPVCFRLYATNMKIITTRCFLSNWLPHLNDSVCQNSGILVNWNKIDCLLALSMCCWQT